mmetsp:Transcript_748/g.1528  ORF Transcript_748/g.1528 Transcript_748/m.1528 type:complete len:285 (-) Transcript_748:138-992(-)
MLVPIPKVPLGHGHLAVQTIPKLGTGAPTAGKATQQLIPMLDRGGNEEICRFEIVRHGHTACTARNADIFLLLLLHEGRVAIPHVRSGNNENVLLLDARVVFLAAVSGLANVPTHGVRRTPPIGTNLAIRLARLLLALLRTARAAGSIPPGNAVTMPIPKVPLGHRHLAVKAVPELDARLTARGVRTHELVPVLDAIGNDKVGSLEVVIDGHAARTARYDGGASCGSQLLVEVLLGRGGVGVDVSSSHGAVVCKSVQSLIESRKSLLDRIELGLGLSSLIESIG